MLLKLIFSLLLFTSISADPVRNVLHFQVEQSDSLYGEISASMDSMASFEVIPAYDKNGTVNGQIIFMFYNEASKFNTDKKDGVDIRDLVDMVSYMFIKE